MSNQQVVHNFTNRQINFMAVCAFLIIPMSGLAVDIYVPSLPAVAKYFHISEALTQVTVTIFLIAYALSQFVAGNIIDAYGRRKITIASLLAFSLFSFCIPQIDSIGMLLLLRFFQGLCVGFFMVSKRAIIVDIYSGVKLQSMLIYTTVAWSLGPIIAPGIGGYLQTFFGWKSCFYFLAGYSFVLAILEFIFVPETIKSKTVLSFTNIKSAYGEILSSSKFNFAVLSLGFSYAMIMLFNLLGAFLIQVTLGYTPIEYGHYALIMGFAWMCGGLANRRLLSLALMTKMRSAVICAMTLALIMFLVGLKSENIYTILIPAFFMHCLAGFIFNNYFAYCLSMFPRYAGTAGGIAGSGAYVVTFIGSSVLAGVLPSSAVTSLATGYFILAVACWLLYKKINSQIAR
ncbi:MAG: MFS transporter [Neisseriaceae bacterium]|nr:MAG: MFS transporter [Neisseriaceae bacterium]